MSFVDKMMRTTKAAAAPKWTIEAAEAPNKLSPVELLSSCTLEMPEVCHDWGGNDKDKFMPHGKVLKDAWDIIGDGVEKEVDAVACKAKLAGLQELIGQSNPKEFAEDLEALTKVLNHRQKHLDALMEAKTTRGCFGNNGGKDVAEAWKKFDLELPRFWGCKAQYAFGKTLVALLHDLGLTPRRLHPYFGVLIFPTGGIAGPGNEALVDWSVRRATVVHACVHDAYGYIYNYHPKEGGETRGPGYSYFGPLGSIFPTSWPIAGQGSGIIATFFILVANGRYGSTWPLYRGE